MATKKKELVNRLEQLISVKMTSEQQALDVFTSHTVQLRDLIQDSHYYLEHNSFKTSEKRLVYVREHLFTLYVNYYAFHEMTLILCQSPSDPAVKANYLFNKIDELNQNKASNIIDYQHFRLEELEITEEIITCFYREQPDIATWQFFDKQHSSMIYIFFEALKLLVSYLEILIRKISNSNVSRLKWTGSQTDLCVLVQNLTLYINKENSEIKAIELARALEQVFDIDISTYYYQKLRSFKNRKGNKPHIIKVLNEMFKQWEEADYDI